MKEEQKQAVAKILGYTPYDQQLQALYIVLNKPPTEQEVCEHLNESFGLKRKNTTLHFIWNKENKEFQMISKGRVYRYISTKRQDDDSIDLIDLDISDIIIIGRFYEAQANEKE